VQVARELEQAINARGEDLGAAALAIARVEYPALEPARYIDLLDRMGQEARLRIAGSDPGTEKALGAFNEYLYDEQGFSGNRQRYDDPRNSFLNEVLDRRTGIPISLAVVYLEVARRAGLRASGVNFPGHFLLRVYCDKSGARPSARGAEGDAPEGRARGRDLPDRRGDEHFVIVDPFHGGARLSEADCRELLRQHVGDEAAFDERLLDPASRHDIIVRMLVNLKRLYVRMRSFPQARFISDLLLTVDPSAYTELRDRGLLAYHLEDFAGALRDLEAYLRLLPKRTSSPEESHVTPDAAADAQQEQSDDVQIWEHVKNLRRRVAGFN
jgi:regulator of sirC expression with transglutaminase-like and TPR domain